MYITWLRITIGSMITWINAENVMLSTFLPCEQDYHLDLLNFFFNLEIKYHSVNVLQNFFCMAKDDKNFIAKCVKYNCMNL